MYYHTPDFWHWDLRQALSHPLSTRWEVCLVKSVFGVILFIVVFIVGHAMNLAINLLGAYVHTNRLQFVEFFGKFYEGGGKPFEPFHAETKYVDIKEEK